MSTKVYTLSFLFICALPVMVINQAIAKDTILPPPTKVSSHLYFWIGPHGGPTVENKGFRMNLGFIVGKKAVAVIESGYHEPMVKEMLQHIQSITSVPVKYVINSNSQPDRFLGNSFFSNRGAKIITSHVEANRMAAMGSVFAAASERALGLKPGAIPIPATPDRMIDSDTELDLGEVTVRLQLLGTAHTPGPIVVYLPQDKVVYAGDVLYSGRLPAIIEGSNISSWIKVFEKLHKFGDVTFVPGHGQPAKLTDFEFATRDYLQLLHTHMISAVKNNQGMIDAVKSLDQSRFEKLENYQELAGRNANLAYLEAEIEAF